MKEQELRELAQDIAYRVESKLYYDDDIQASCDYQGLDHRGHRYILSDSNIYNDFYITTYDDDIKIEVIEYSREAYSELFFIEDYSNTDELADACSTWLYKRLKGLYVPSLEELEEEIIMMLDNIIEEDYCKIVNDDKYQNMNIEFYNDDGDLIDSIKYPYKQLRNLLESDKIKDDLYYMKDKKL